MPLQRYAAAVPFPEALPSKWRPFNNSAIFQPICFKFEYKVDPRIGNDVVSPPHCYGDVRGAVAPFPAAPPSKSRPFYNFVILYLAKTMFCQVLCFHP